MEPASALLVVGSCVDIIRAVQSLQTYLMASKDAPKDLKEITVETEKLVAQIHQIHSTLGKGRSGYGRCAVIEALQTSIELCDSTKRTLSISANHLKSRRNCFGEHSIDCSKVTGKWLSQSESQNSPVCSMHNRHESSKWERPFIDADRKEKRLLWIPTQPFSLTVDFKTLACGAGKEDPVDEKFLLYPLGKYTAERRSSETLLRLDRNGEENLGIAWQVFHTEQPFLKAKTFPLDQRGNLQLPTSTQYAGFCEDIGEKRTGISHNSADFERTMKAETKVWTHTKSSVSLVLRRLLSSINLDATVHQGIGVKSRQTHMRRTVEYVVKIATGCALCMSALVMSQYDSSHSGASQQTFGLSRAIWKFKSVIRLGLDSSDDWMVLNTLCAPALVVEAPHMTLDPWSQVAQESCSFNLSRAVFEAVETGPCSPRTQLPKFLREPSPAIFFDAAMIFWISSMAFYLLHRDDRKQNVFVCAGSILGCCLGLGLSWMRGDIDPFMGFLPWTLVFSLISSAVFHQMARISHLVRLSIRPSCDSHRRLPTSVKYLEFTSEGEKKHELHDPDQNKIV
ncbi:hypothetical protein N431DRAFT_478439 [Stipitochalara longipes BDJ]|nr:hypothetical protein N431DRAFT_478439 [Stipitochalara longipes BDJ]